MSFFQSIINFFNQGYEYINGIILFFQLYKTEIIEFFDNAMFYIVKPFMIIVIIAKFIKAVLKGGK